MSGHREPKSFQEPLLLRCLGGPTDGEERGCHRSWWPVGDENGRDPAGVYVRLGVRGGAVFKWYALPGGVKQLLVEIAVSQDLRDFLENV